MKSANKRPEMSITITRTEQATQELLRRITTGEWGPGAMLPSEHQLARQLDVSQGTARKALGLLEQRGILERHQGRGTFVATTTPEKALFRFFRLRHPDGRHATPKLEQETVSRRAPNARETALLGDGSLFEIERVRSIDGRRAVAETIVVPQSLFPGLDARSPLPNALYALFQKVYSVSIEHTSEQASTALATGTECKTFDAALQVDPGAPLLIVDRQATDLSGRVVELRRSRYALFGGLTYSIGSAAP